MVQFCRLRGAVSHNGFYVELRRILRPGIAFVLPEIVAADSKLRRAFRNLTLEIENWIENAKLVAA